MDKIAIIDFGGQYAHLIGSRIRKLGVYSEIWSPDLHEYLSLSHKKQAEYKGIILSGGPQSVYDSSSVRVNKIVYDLGLPILAICYGHHLVLHDLGGKITQGKTHEYGPAKLKFSHPLSLFRFSKQKKYQVWMSHGDEVESLPEGFITTAGTKNCKHAACFYPERKIATVQFHPEVTHTEIGLKLLSNFIYECGAQKSWSMKKYLESEMNTIKKQVGKGKVFMLVSGGVDSTVAYVLLAKAIGKKNIVPLYVDTGFMRYKETVEVKSALEKLGLNLQIYNASKRYFKALKKVYAPEEKRKIIGKLFVDIQEEESKKLKLDSGNWFLGQGTIYPDTIESGATKHSATIKTHHNRVAEIQKLLDEGKVVEPIRNLYKDEVRSLGKLLHIPKKLLYRQPFPGPGLAVRILNFSPDKNNKKKIKTLQKKAKSNLKKFLKHNSKLFKNYKTAVLPLLSVGVKGDKRSYEMPAVIYGKLNWKKLKKIASAVPGSVKGINRVLYCLTNKKSPRTFRSTASYCTKARVKDLQLADKIVNDFQEKYKLGIEIWQFPVALIPVSSNKYPQESLVLRPVQSSEAMTVNFYEMKKDILKKLTKQLKALNLFDAIYYDITDKPPGTIEWE